MPTLLDPRPGLAAGALAWSLLASWPAAQQQPLRPPLAPYENPLTVEKAILGKVLFWDEQLSSDGAVACGTCHQPAAGGADARLGRHPGFDRQFGTADDVFGSPGIVASDAQGDYQRSALFGLKPQVTSRTAATIFGAPWVSALRWDGLALETVTDPETGQLLMMFGGALESHAAGPPVSTAEMAYHGRDWTAIAAKIAAVRPLALASNLPPDLVQALSGDPDYGELMRRAFGDRAVTGRRIVYAIASYERTLVPDQSPWDAWLAGNQTALTADQQAGRALFEGAAGCARCHPAPLFSDGSFRNLGLRPVREDLGWQLATSDPTDRGKFKVPSLRNVGLRSRFMHNGQFATLAEVVELYDRGGGPFTGNKDPALQPLGLSPQQKASLVDFLQHGLTDPRVRAETAPFDRPTLWSERAPLVFGQGHAGSGGYVPRPLVESPLSIGQDAYRVGVADALGGAVAAVAFATARGPVGQRLGPLHLHVAITPPPLVGLVTLQGSGPGDGYATVHLPIPADPSLAGLSLYHQWLVVDPGAVGGLAASPGAGGPLHYRP